MGAYQNPQTAIDAGGHALRTSSEYPWYDKTNDTLQRVEVPLPVESGSHHFRAELNALVYLAALAVLAAGVTALLVMMFRARRLRRPPSRQAEAMLIGEAQRIEALPYPIAQRNLSLLEQAGTFRQAGNYAAAMIYLFSHQLVQLDRRHVIHLSKGKTNRQYLREIGQPTLRMLINQTLVAFEDAFFGHHDIDRWRFETCWSRLPEFDSLLMEARPARA